MSPDTYIVVATLFDNDEHLFPAVEAGVQGYLLKDLSNNEFTNCLKDIIKGKPPISPSIIRKLITHFNHSNHQKTIFLQIPSLHTLKIYSKLNVTTRAEATLEALRLA